MSRFQLLRPVRRVALGGITLSLLLSGCAVPPPPARLAPPADAASFASERSFAALDHHDWPSDGWWRAYNDLQLDQLIAEGVASATDLRVAEARFNRARAIVGQSRSQLMPTLTASAEAGVSQQSDNYLFPSGFAPRGWPDYGQASLALNWELDFWGKNRAALSAAKSEAQAAEAEAAASRLAVSAGIASAYADLASLYVERDAAGNAVKIRRQTYDLMKMRKAQGLETDGPVKRAESALATAKGEAALLDENLALARNRIAALMGAGPDRGLKIARPTLNTAVTVGLPANIPAELIGRRPDIIAARLRAEASSSRIKQAKAAFYPSINLNAIVGMQALGLGNVFKSGSDFGSAAPAISLPIFDGGRLRSSYRGAEADCEQAVAQYDGTLVQALREVADAATMQRALGHRLEQAKIAESAAEAAWHVADNRYRGGLATYLDVLVAEDSLIAARRAVASLQTRAFSLDVALVRALGGGFRS
ncbi:efflux transporter outer membrane subunit [Novosphingobium sp.]|uniref:efflux transporter outer membrane subunit n=1 Tax=Novosphingobium sp. TaxID=1874826 RepID=UPI0035623C3E